MSQMWIEYGYRHNDGSVTPMNVRYLPNEPPPDTFLLVLNGEPVTPIKRYVTAGDWERVIGLEDWREVGNGIVDPERNPL
jgi:hypothetical protein